MSSATLGPAELFTKEIILFNNLLLGSKANVNSINLTLSSFARSALITDKSVIKELRAKLDKVKFMELTLAFDPSSKLLNKIISLVKSSAGPNVALDIKIDKGIIGGAVIAYNGKYGDFSLSGKLESVLKNYA